MHTSVYVADFKGSIDEKQPPSFAANQPLRKNQTTKRGEKRKWNVPRAAICKRLRGTQCIKPYLFQRHIRISNRHAWQCAPRLRKNTTLLNRACFVAMRQRASCSPAFGTSYARRVVVNSALTSVFIQVGDLFVIIGARWQTFSH